MRELLVEAWRRIQPELRAHVGSAAYDAWLAELRLLGLERGILHLEAKNRLTADKVAALHRDVIADCVGTELGTRIGVEVEPAPESLVPDALEVGPTNPVIDASNRTAVLALKALLEGRTMPSRLFLFHGERGTGKTFLLQWWRNLVREPCRRLTGPQLLKAIQVAVRERRIEGLRREFVNDRPLVLDEIHRLSGYRRAQLEVAKILEERHTRDAPTLLASRWHPREIWKLEPTLESWLLSGFVARIEAPGPVARIAYLRALEGAASRNGRADAVEHLAREMRGTYPELRRAWAVERHGTDRPAHTWELIEPRSAFDRLCDRIVQHLDVTRDDLIGQSQKRRVSFARKVLSWLCVQEGLSRAEVGRYLGGRTRAAISYAIKSLERELTRDEALRRRVESLQ